VSVAGRVFRGDRVGDSVVMMAANGGADPDARPERRWAVALSFAGAQRDYGGQVAAALKAQECAASTTGVPDDVPPE
jgi:hypothetical protein